MTTTPTPRTDVKTEYYLAADMSGEVETVPADFARGMERELAEAKRKEADWQMLADLTKRDLDAERALADRLAGELQWWGDYCGDNAPASIDRSLAAWKEARRE